MVGVVMMVGGVGVGSGGWYTDMVVVIVMLAVVLG